MKYSAFFILVFSSISQAQSYPRVSGTEYDFLEDGVTYEFLEGETVSTTFRDLPDQTFTIICSHQIEQQRNALWDSASEENSACLERVEKTRDACNAAGKKECKRIKDASENKASRCYESQQEQKCPFDFDSWLEGEDRWECFSDLEKACKAQYLISTSTFSI